MKLIVLNNIVGDATIVVNISEYLYKYYYISLSLTKLFK